MTIRKWTKDKWQANTGLWLNDYVTISTNSKPGNGNYDNLKKFTRELLDAGVELEGLGFQGHIGGFPNGIPSVLETLDDFHNEFGLISDRLFYLQHSLLADKVNLNNVIVFTF